MCVGQVREAEVAGGACCVAFSPDGALLAVRPLLLRVPLLGQTGPESKAWMSHSAGLRQGPSIEEPDLEQPSPALV